ncbi:MAG: hypothetical protein NC429_10275 [Lachnospiraceae bacterium]|nr:hypothetical protein [Lachnospiraceae bacterium]
MEKKGEINLKKNLWLRGLFSLAVIIFLGSATISCNAEDNLDNNSLLNLQKENEAI